jgi:hypothetical protein
MSTVITERKLRPRNRNEYDFNPKTALLISLDFVFNIFYTFVGYYRHNMERLPYDHVGHQHHMSNPIPPGPPHPGLLFPNS